MMTRQFLGGAAIAFALIGTTPALAASTAPMTSKAMLLKPLTLTKLDDLDFGSIIPSGSGQIVTIDANTGARSSSYIAGLVPSDAGHRARFASSGVNNTMVVLELSATPADLTNADGKTMSLTGLQLDSGGVIRTLTPASQVFFVGIGGTVFVRSNQEEGVYSGTFTLTATYL
jgi:hypothetical protein